MAFWSDQNKEILRYKNEKPLLNLTNYLSGTVIGYGLISNFFGRVTSRFVVTIQGSWDNNTGVLDEDFQFLDGSTLKRHWDWRIDDDVKFTGTADDIVGEAKGVRMGNAINTRYTIKLNRGNREIRLHADDWIYLIDERRAINISKMKKFGLTFATLTIFCEKQQ